MSWVAYLLFDSFKQAGWLNGTSDISLSMLSLYGGRRKNKHTRVKLSMHQWHTDKRVATTAFWRWRGKHDT